MSLLDRIISVEGLINTLRMKVVQAMNIFKSKNVVSYKVYSALLTQSGTDAPVATILENTIGDIVWTRSSLGLYVGTLSGAFVAGKTICFGTENEVGGNFALCISRLDNNIVMVADYDETWSPVGNTHMSIEIRVYTTEVAAQTIPDILGNTGKYLRTDGSTLSWDSPNIAPTLQDVLTNGSIIVSDATVNSGNFAIDIIAGASDLLTAAGQLEIAKTNISLSVQDDDITVNSQIGVAPSYASVLVTNGSNSNELRVTPVAAILTSNGTAFNLIPPKRYVALLTQSGTSAPVATVLENTIGNIVWTRVSAGIYMGTLSTAFPADKTIVLGDTGLTDSISDFYRKEQYWGDSSNIIISTGKFDFNVPSLTLFDDTLGTAAMRCIKIEVYP